MLPEIPTNVPVYLGPRSAWLTPNPPWQTPEQKLIKHNKRTTLDKSLWSEIKYKKIDDPKKPIEFTLFLTFITFYPIDISLSAKKPPKIREKMETRLGIKIAYIKIFDPNSIPIPPSINGAFINFGKYERKVYKAQLLQNVATAIAKNGPFLSNLRKGMDGGVEFDGASFLIRICSLSEIFLLSSG